MTYFTGWTDHLCATRPQGTACDQVDVALRRRRKAGLDTGPRLAAKLTADIHNRHAMGGTPCPCGRRFPSVRASDVAACDAEHAFRRRDRRAVRVIDGGR